jgi:beta-xylosidase
MRTSNIRLKMHIKGAAADFAYADGNGNWTTVLTDADARLLATEYDILLFTGTVVGLYSTDVMN